MSLVLGRLSSPDEELIDTSRSLIYEINVYKYDLAPESIDTETILKKLQCLKSVRVMMYLVRGFKN